MADNRTSSPRLSLILLTFNRWDRTSKLLDSLSADPGGYDDVELVWIENGSTDGTRNAFETWLHRHRNFFHSVVRRRNDVNHGFVVGVNEGLSVATGAYICLVNSDAVITPDWRAGLFAALGDEADGVAAVGPVSDGMPWHQSLKFRGQGVQAVPVVYGFCLLARRAVIERTGLLDERYGRGVVEVEDWCERARRLGLEFRVNTDVLVLHDEPHASYTPRVNAMLHIRNRRLFEAKWGVGPYYWGKRDTAPTTFARTEVRIPPRRAPWMTEIAADLAAAPADTEFLVVLAHSDEADHLAWIGTARRDTRLHVVCVPPDWDTRWLDELCLANARAPEVVFPR
jgi:GT2 family glycosyltransferase